VDFFFVEKPSRLVGVAIENIAAEDTVPVGHEATP
jgi:hypothetical protein